MSKRDYYEVLGVGREASAEELKKAYRQAALKYSLDFGRGLDESLTDRFVGMYVNDLTRDYGDRGREAIRRFLAEGRQIGLVPDFGEVEFV